MVKRTYHTAHEDDIAPERKRSKPNDDSTSNKEPPITSARFLKLLLAFHQDDVAQYRLNLQRFRRYLEDLPTCRKSESLEDGVLLQYLNESMITTASDQVEIIPDIFQAWRYAVQVYDEGLMPTIPGILAILLRTVSSSLKFVDLGIQICRTVMRKENVQLLQKSMNSSRTRDTTIARCLDLLTQIVSFDGGACAKTVWMHRSVTMSRLHQLIAMSKKTIYAASGSTSVRDHAISFLLANLRYQDQEAKAEILSNRKSAQNMLRDMLSEPHDTIVKILSTLKQHVVEDLNLGRAAKGHLLTDSNLGYVLAVMRQVEEGDEWESLKGIAEDFLIESCTSRLQGILYKQNGWYPPGTEDVTIKEDILFFGGTFHAADAAQYKDRVPVRNTTLAAFIQDLKPWASIPERKLITGIFEAAPELIADYFVRKKAFSFEPKLTATWIGWATLIYSVLQLPFVSHDMYLDGRIRQPPPVAVILQSILPQPLTSQALTKALKQKSELIKLFTLRILVAAFKKLEQVLSSFQTASSPSIWQATAAELLNEFQTRCPEYKQVLNLYQSLPKDKHILQEASVSLLASYHTTAPQLILNTKFDVSSRITSKLSQVVEEGNDCDASTLLELQHLLTIGSCVIEAKWWHKPEHATVSTVTTMLQLLSSARLSQNDVLKSLVRSILEESFILSIYDGVDALGALLKSLATVTGSSSEEHIYTFLDDCLLRLVRKPIRYYGDVRDLVKEDTATPSVSPAFMVLLEQWPFFMKAHSSVENRACAEWICAYLEHSSSVGQARAQLEALCERFAQATEQEEAKGCFEQCKSLLNTKKQSSNLSEIEIIGDAHDSVRDSASNSKERHMAALDLRLRPEKETEDYPALTKWQMKDVAEAVLNGDITNLIYCLASSYQEIRLQASTAIKLFMTKVQSSTYEERQSLHLLLGIVHETISQHGSTTPLPGIAISIAARSIAVISNPLHHMYTKINHFLSRAPVWNLAKLPSYWMDRVFHKPPTQLNAHWKEVDWLLDTLLDGLRNSDGINLYRRTGVFERIIVNCTTTFTPRLTYEKMIDVIYRCALVGGATTLITRFGILAWIASQKLTNPKAETLLSALECKIRHECDAERVFEWSHGAIRCNNKKDTEKDDQDDNLDCYERLQLWTKPAAAGEQSRAEKATAKAKAKGKRPSYPYRHRIEAMQQEASHPAVLD